MRSRLLLLTIEGENLAHDKTGIRWVRVIAAGVLTEVCVIAIMVAVMTTHNLMARGETLAEQTAFAGRAGSLIGPAGGALLAFLFALWACRRLKSDFILNGLLVGLVAAIVHIAMFLSSGMGFQLIYVIADALKIVAGVAGGYAAQKKFERASSSVS